MLRILKTAILAVALGLSMALTLTPAAQAGGTITLTDTEGRQVTVPHGAQRVLLGFYFEDFYAIVGPDAFKRVVAISRATWEGWRNTQWQAYTKVIPEIEQLADVGEIDSGTFNIEAAIAARPDVAVFAGWQYRGLGEAVNKLEAAGIPVVVVDYNAQTVEKHVASTLVLGKLMATEARAEELANNYKNAVDEVTRRIAALKEPRKKVYVELGNKGPQEYGNSYAGGMWAGVIGQAGGDNIAEGKIERWGPLSPEYVVASRPEVIFIPGSGWAGRDKAVLMGFGIDEQATRERLSPYTGRAGWGTIPAVQKGEVHSVYHGGTRTLYDYAFLQYIAKTLYPEAFADIDPQESHRKYYETYLPIKADGSFMVKLK